jgi:hypothetical protein
MSASGYMTVPWPAGGRGSFLPLTGNARPTPRRNRSVIFSRKDYRSGRISRPNVETRLQREPR